MLNRLLTRTDRRIGALALVLAALCGGCIPTSVDGPDAVDDRAELMLTDASDVPPPGASTNQYKPVSVDALDLPAPPATSHVTPDMSAAPEPRLTVAPSYAAPRIHIVQTGQTLWKISGMYYGRSSMAGVNKIVAANPEIVNPNVIRVGQRLVIPD